MIFSIVLQTVILNQFQVLTCIFIQCLMTNGEGDKTTSQPFIQYRFHSTMVSVVINMTN